MTMGPQGQLMVLLKALNCPSLGVRFSWSRAALGLLDIGSLILQLPSIRIGSSCEPGRLRAGQDPAKLEALAARIHRLGPRILPQSRGVGTRLEVLSYLQILKRRDPHLI